MSIFLPQYRGLKLCKGKLPKFPAAVCFNISFGPEDAFGLPCIPRTTAPPGKRFSTIFDANEGTTSVSAELIRAVKASTTVEGLLAEFEMNRLIIKFSAKSLQEMHILAVRATQLLPPIISLYLKTYVWIKKFNIKIKASQFRFEVYEFSIAVNITTAERNEARLIKSISDWQRIRPKYARLISSLYYFRQARRLSMIEPDRHSMAAEVLLNLTKSLEILFTDDRDTLRTRAKTWGIPVKEIEQKIIPIFLLRNEIDVAHVSTGHLNKQERHTIFGFTVAAIDNVQQILLPIYEKVISDQIVLEPVSYSLTSHRKKLLADIKEYLNHN